MKIGELAKKTGLSIDAIRFYEKSGLIKGPKRTDGGYREFDSDTAAALEFISHARSLDIPLPEIKKLLRVRSGSVKSCREANEVIEVQLSNLRNRIKELKRLEKSLSDLQAVCRTEVNPENCKIIRDIEKLPPARK